MRIAVLYATEYAIEVREIAEAAIVGNLTDGHGGIIDQHACHCRDADIVEILHERTACAHTDESGECRSTHIDQFCHFVELDLLLIVLLQVLGEDTHSAAIVDLVESAELLIGEDAGILVLGYQVEQREEGQYRLEVATTVDELLNQFLRLEDGLQAERQAMLRFLEHLLDRRELCAPKHAIGREKGFGELDRDLAYLSLYLPIAINPCMFELTACDEHHVILANGLDTITHDASCTLGSADEIQFIDIVYMNGVIEVLLSSFEQHEHVLLGDRGYFGKYSVLR